jgi:antigen flippase
MLSAASMADIAGTFRQGRRGKGVFASVVQTLGANILIQGVNVGTGVITARILAPHGRGDFTAMSMWPGFLSVLFSMGLQTSLIYQLKQGAGRIDDFIGTALALGFIGGTLAMITGIIGIPYWLHSYSPEVIKFARLAMLLAPVTLVGAILSTSAQAAQNFGRFNTFRAFPPLLILSMLLILANAHKLTPLSTAVIYLLAPLPIYFWNGIWAFRRFNIRFNNVAKYTPMLLGYGVRIWGMDLVGALSDQVDRVLVIGFLTPSDLGLYVVALSAARVFSIIPAALSLVVSPKIVLLGTKEGAPLVVRVARTAFVVMCAGAIPLGIFAPEAVKLVYGVKFAASTPVFRVLLAEAVIGGFTWLLAQGFAFLGKPGRATIQQITGLSTSIPLLLFLVPRFGIDGACYAILASTTLRAIFAIVSYRSLFGENLSHFTPRFSDLQWIVSQITSPKAKGGAMG